MTFSDELVARAAALLEGLRSQGLTLATAESCTGGLLAGLLTEIPGSSAVVDRGFVTYSNAAKSEVLGVDPALIATEGAVSEAVARAMAEGARTRAGVDLAVAVTGIAGPGGATSTKAVGLVHFGLASVKVPTCHLRRTYGDPGRSAVRLLALADALLLLEQALAEA